MGKSSLATRAQKEREGRVLYTTRRIIAAASGDGPEVAIEAAVLYRAVDPPTGCSSWRFDADRLHFWLHLELVGWEEGDSPGPLWLRRDDTLTNVFPLGLTQAEASPKATALLDEEARELRDYLEARREAFAMRWHRLAGQVEAITPWISEETLSGWRMGLAESMGLAGVSGIEGGRFPPGPDKKGWSIDELGDETAAETFVRAGILARFAVEWDPHTLIGWLIFAGGGQEEPLVKHMADWWLTPKAILTAKQHLALKPKREGPLRPAELAAQAIADTADGEALLATNSVESFVMLLGVDKGADAANEAVRHLAARLLESARQVPCRRPQWVIQ